MSVGVSPSAASLRTKAWQTCAITERNLSLISLSFCERCWGSRSTGQGQPATAGLFCVFALEEGKRVRLCGRVRTKLLMCIHVRIQFGVSSVLLAGFSYGFCFQDVYVVMVFCVSNQYILMI